MLPVPFDFRHNALKIRVSAKLVPILVTLKPGKIVIPEPYGSSQPRERGFLLAQQVVIHLGRKVSAPYFIKIRQGD